jgi:hypothetical protein
VARAARKARTSVRLVVIDVALTSHHPGLVSQSCEQLDPSAVGSPGAPDCLAINRYSDQVRPRTGYSTTISVAVTVVGVVLNDRVRDLGFVPDDQSCGVGSHQSGAGDLPAGPPRC